MLWAPVLAAIAIMGFCLARRRSPAVFVVLCAVVMLSMLLSLFYFIADLFTAEGLTSAVVFHVLNAMETDNAIGMAQFPELVALVIGAGGLLLVWMVLARRVASAPQESPSLSSWQTLVLTVLAAIALPLHPALAEGYQLWQELAPRNEDVLGRELKALPADAVPPPRPRSLVFIYAESYERAFLDQTHFPGLADGLLELERDSLSFRGIGEAPLTDWTIAGMVASQCGMPLATISPDMSDPGLGRTRFLPGAGCLGDLLESWRYRLAYVGGARMDFAGKGDFYATHGFDDIIGVDEISTVIGEGFARSKWGAYDADVFSAAMSKFRGLNAGPEPFALFLLTTGTHPPGGYPSPACQGTVRYGDGANNMLNAADCSDGELAAFVRGIEAEARDDVVVVIASDHLQRASGASSQFNARGLARENLLLIRGAGRSGAVQRDASTMDIAPTIASVLGGDVQEIGLGRNLLGEAPTLTERYGRKDFHAMVQSWRVGLWRAWQSD
nr:sulfatase-like hydrolase/transferase [Xanthomonas sp. XNM01]